MSLSPKQERFVSEYLIDLNGTQAAIRAGYSAKTASVQSFALLRKPNIQEEISKRQAILAGKLGVTVDSIVKELAKIGFSDIRKAAVWRSNCDTIGTNDDGDVAVKVGNYVELIDSDMIDDATAGAISEISMTDKGALKVKFHDKRAALVDLGKHLGMFTEKLDVTVKEGFEEKLLRARARATKR